MGLFSSLFGNSDSLESRLVREMTVAYQAIMGNSQQEANKMARELVAQAKQVVAERGLTNQPPNRGDLLLQQEASNPKIHAKLEAIRREGVTNDDIRWWWNMHPLEQVVMEKSDEINSMSPWLYLVKQGMEPDEAAKHVFRIHPKFGNPEEGDGDDRPLPIELKRRTIEFTERHFNSPERFRAMTDGATSFNALIRAEIRAGRL